MLIELTVSSCICAVASFYFIRRYRRHRKFTMNSLVVAYVYNGLWIPAATVHFLSFCGVEVSPALATVKNMQVSLLLAAASNFMTVLARLCYKPIFDAMLLQRSMQASSLLSLA